MFNILLLNIDNVYSKSQQKKNIEKMVLTTLHKYLRAKVDTMTTNKKKTNVSNEAIFFYSRIKHSTYIYKYRYKHSTYIYKYKYNICILLDKTGQYN